MIFRVFITILWIAGIASCEKNDCKKNPTTIQVGLTDDTQTPEQDCGVNLDSQPAVETSTSTSTPAPQSPPVTTSVPAVVLPDADSPVISPSAGAYSVPQSVTLASSTSGVTIYYTTDGATPTKTSSVYSSPLSISQSTTIKAIAVKDGYNNSQVSSFAFTIGLSLPDLTFGPAAGAYGPAQSISINSSFSPDAIYYTVDGSVPTTSSTVYSGPVYVGTSQTIKALAVKAGWANSQVASAAYVINGAVSTPYMSVAGGAYGPAQSVTLASTTIGTAIYYTTDGSIPTTASTQYTGPVTVNASLTLKAIAIKQDYVDSAIASATYTINGTAATPTFSVAPGAYGPAQTVAIATTTPAAAIYYTTDGSTPTTASLLYSSPIAVISTQTIKAIAVKTYYSNSSIASATYTINGQVATPTFNVPGGAYGPAQSITLSSSTTGATIYYTTNGSTPTTSSSLYSSAITVSTSLTIKAIAVKANYIDSAQASASYTINGTVATPTFSPNGGTYSTTQSVSITTTTPSASIYYTTNNTTPTTSSTLYTGPVTISATTTLRALATRTNFTTSAIQVQTYVITTYGTITTIAGTGVIGSSGDSASATSARLYAPSGIALDSNGNIYIADTQNNKIRRVDKITNVITTIAGTGLPSYGGDGSAAIDANLQNPYGLAFDGNGDLVFSDQFNNRIRKINMTSGNISTIAGDGTMAFGGDGSPATSANLQLPAGIAFNTAGELFIADKSNHRIRKLATDGIITTVAGTGTIGSGGDGGSATSAQLSSPSGVTVSSNNRLYIADSGNNKIRVVDLATGIISTFAGTGTSGYTGNGGLATAATLTAPKGLKFDSSNNLLFADQFNHVIRMVAAGTNIISTVVGTGSPGYSGDSGYSVNATLQYPIAINLDSANNLYITDFYNNVIRKALRVP